MMRCFLIIFGLAVLGSSPALAQCDGGDMLFNKGHEVLQWCDGEQWIGLPKPPDTGTWASISVSQNGQHSCGVTASGEGYCWGYNVYGQLGWGSGNFYVPVPVSGNYRWKTISAGEQHSCGVTTSGDGYCWGRNYRGELGNGQSGLTASSNVPVPVSGDLSWSWITAGSVYSCGVTTSGDGYCWGDGTSGKLGRNSTAASTVPVLVSGSQTWALINAGTTHTCGVTAAGEGYCWGAGNYGRLGNGVAANSNIPVPVSGGYTWSSIVAGTAHSCGMTTTGEGYCWGRGASGALGYGGDADSSIPANIAGGHKWAAIGAGNQYGCGLTSEGQAYCWGSSTYGQRGDGGTANSSSPVPVSGEYEFRAIGVGNLHTCAIGPDGAKCWGRNSFGQLGNDSQTDSSVPVAAQEGSSWTTITAGTSHACGVTASGEGYCWGNGTNGRLGNSDTHGSLVPSPVTGGYTWSSISAGGAHTCGVTAGGTAFCWGEGDDGRLGASIVDRNAPVAVSGGLNFSFVSAGGEHTCGITTSGEGYCWGQGNSGQLGTGTSSSYYTSSVPVAVAGGLVWSSISTGQAHTCGVTTNGDGYCWGFGVGGRLGNGDTFNSSSPQPVSGSLSWSSLNVTSSHACGVTTEGDGYCWGVGADGQLGNGDQLDRSIPTLVSGNHKWSIIATGSAQSCGITTTGTAYCWGSGANGRLGNGETTSSNVPVPVSGSMEWSSISSGGSFSCGIDTSERWYCWGMGSYGRLGNGQSIDQLSPVIGTKSIISANCVNGSAGDVIYNADHKVLQWCDGKRWIGLPKPPIIEPDACEAGPVGTVCSDGAIYAGDLSGRRLYVVPDDESGNLKWASSSHNDNGSSDEYDGLANTDFLVSDGQSHPAAEACRTRGPEWYLPAQREMNVLYNNRSAINGGFTSSAWYWSSTQFQSSMVQYRMLSGGVTGTTSKTSTALVRCMRAGSEAPAPGGGEAGCTEGEMLYNADHAVMQWCDGEQWVGFPKPSSNEVDFCETGSIGSVCEDGAIYAGELNGKRLYAAAADETPSPSWNNDTSNYTVTGVASLTDGLGNTNTLVSFSDAGAPYMAAETCRARGAGWYLPAINELNVLYVNRDTIGGFDTSFYSSSTESDAAKAKILRFRGDGQLPIDGYKSNEYMVRCIRQNN